jgi:hypothetical protein
MPARFAYECYADGDICTFLRAQCNLPLAKQHSFSQGEVVNDVLIRDHADIGMVDEDPMSSHHRRRDTMQIIDSNEDLELRRSARRYLIILKPDLENCFIRSMRRVGLDSELPSESSELRAILNLPRHPKHRLFMEELGLLRERSRERKTPTFITRLEDCLRVILTNDP